MNEIKIYTTVEEIQNYWKRILDIVNKTISVSDGLQIVEILLNYTEPIRDARHPFKFPNNSVVAKKDSVSSFGIFQAFIKAWAEVHAPGFDVAFTREYENEDLKRFLRFGILVEPKREKVYHINKHLLGSFEDYCDFVDYIKKEYRPTKDELEGFIPLVRIHDEEDCSRQEWMLLFKEGKLYENFGSHCSCYGMEDQFKPVEIPLDFILSNHNIFLNGYLPDKENKIKELKEQIKRLVYEQS